MIYKTPEIVFMGTPSFAVPSLEALIENGYHISAVVTAPDRPSGRGLKISESEVKKAAVAKNIPVLQPSNLKDESFASDLRSYSAGLFVVIAFRMLPEKVWRIPPMGTINLHASLLPRYRGAAPINHAIINGEKVTGVTTFLIDREIDTGKILLQERTEIGDNETAGQLHDRLMKIGAGLLLKTVDKMTSGIITPVSQNDLMEGDDIPVAPKLTRSDCRIDWSLPSWKIHNFVRGLSPYPSAWTRLFSGGRKMDVKIFEIVALPDEHRYSPGEVVSLEGGLTVAAGKGIVIIKNLRPEGKKQMAAEEFIKGFRPTGGEHFV